MHANVGEKAGVSEYGRTNRSHTSGEAVAIIEVVVMRVTLSAEAMANLLYPHGLVIAPGLILELINLLELLRGTIPSLVRGFSTSCPQQHSKCNTICLSLIGVMTHALECVQARHQASSPAQ